MKIKSLENVTFDTIFKAFTKAFGDYELQLNDIQLQSMLKRRGFNGSLSFAAFEGDEIVAFTLNRIGCFNGVSTAYDTGTGTLPEYRGRGLATKIFEYSLPYLKEKNIEQYLLEVLQHNTKAVSVYKKIGFEVAREFYYFRQENNFIHNVDRIAGSFRIIQPLDIEKNDLSVFWDFYPSWQNSFESIRRSVNDFICLGIFTDEKLIGYSVFEPASGDVTQIAVDKRKRRRGIGSLLFQEMVRLNKSDVVKVINTDITCDLITGFLKAKNIEVKGKQFEMIRKI